MHLLASDGIARSFERAARSYALERNRDGGVGAVVAVAGDGSGKFARASALLVHSYGIAS